MAQKFKQAWDYLQSVLDVKGDVVMLVMSGVFVFRILAVYWGKAPLTASESAMYASAIGSFAWSNK